MPSEIRDLSPGKPVVAKIRANSDCPVHTISTMKVIDAGAWAASRFE